MMTKINHQIKNNDKDRIVVNHGILLGVFLYLINSLVNIWFLNLALGIYKMVNILNSGIDPRIYSLSIQNTAISDQSIYNTDVKFPQENFSENNDETILTSKHKNSIEHFEMLSNREKMHIITQ